VGVVGAHPERLSILVLAAAGLSTALTAALPVTLILPGLFTALVRLTLSVVPVILPAVLAAVPVLVIFPLVRRARFAVLGSLVIRH
jgi:hypothetical protein